MTLPIQVIGIKGLPLIHAGDDIPALICGQQPVKDGDILHIRAKKV